MVTKPLSKAGASPEDKYQCMLCGHRKVSADFPLNIAGTKHIRTDCTSCLHDNSISSSTSPDFARSFWTRLGLKYPGPPSATETESKTSRTISQKRKYPINDNNGYTIVQAKRSKVSVIPSNNGKPAAARSTLPTAMSTMKLSDYYRKKLLLPYVPDVECCICLNSKPVDSFPRRSTIPDTCVGCVSTTGQSPSCNDCIERHFTAALDDRQATQLACPICNTIWDYHSIRQNLSLRAFFRYESLLFLQAVASIEGFRWCPGAECGSGEIHDTEDDHFPSVICHYCQLESCYHHQIPWHTGLTCAEYDATKRGLQEKRAEKKTRQSLITRGARHCPNCRYIIIKNGGCHHMYCENCYFDFNWLEASLVKNE